MDLMLAVCGRCDLIRLLSVECLHSIVFAATEQANCKTRLVFIKVLLTRWGMVHVLFLLSLKLKKSVLSGGVVSAF